MNGPLLKYCQLSEAVRILSLTIRVYVLSMYTTPKFEFTSIEWSTLAFVLTMATRVVYNSETSWLPVRVYTDYVWF
jgi:uncharacterized membrane protein (Fun14 family)